MLHVTLPLYELNYNNTNYNIISSLKEKKRRFETEILNYI